MFFHFVATFYLHVKPIDMELSFSYCIVLFGISCRSPIDYSDLDAREEMPSPPLAFEGSVSAVDYFQPFTGSISAVDYSRPFTGSKMYVSIQSYFVIQPNNFQALFSVLSKICTDQCTPRF